MTTYAEAADPQAQEYARSVLHSEGQQILSSDGDEWALQDMAVEIFGLTQAGYLDYKETWEHLSQCAVGAGASPHIVRDALELAWERSTPDPVTKQEVRDYLAGTPHPSLITGPAPAPVDPRFRLLGRAEIDAIPDLEPMINGIMDKGTVTMLTAQPGAYKSFLAVDWACRYATGTAWQNHPVTTSGKVLYLAAEGARSIKKRLQAWEKAWGHQVPEDRFIMLPEPVNLGSEPQVELFCHRIKEAGPFGLVIIDTIARCSLGMEENSATDMGKIIDSLYKIREAMGDHGTVLAVHHEGKNGTVRGSSALLGGVDQLMSLKRDGEHITLADEKKKDGPEMAPKDLRVNAIHGSLVIEAAGDEWEQANPLLGEMENLAPLGAMTRTELKLASSLPERSLYNHLAAGLKSGAIRTDNGKNPRYSLTSNGDHALS